MCVYFTCFVCGVCVLGHFPLVCSFLPLMSYLFQYLVFSREMESWPKDWPVIWLSQTEHSAEFLFTLWCWEPELDKKNCPEGCYTMTESGYLEKSSLGNRSWGTQLKGMRPKNRKLHATRSGREQVKAYLENLEPSVIRTVDIAPSRASRGHLKSLNWVGM